MTPAGSPLGGFKDAKIHVAIYESVPYGRTTPSRRDRPTWKPAPSTPGRASRARCGSWARRRAQDANKPVTFTQQFDPKLMVDLEVPGPGRIRVLINGKNVSRQSARRG